ncbi:MAG: hypothetical protein E6J49_00400 [Chloroflexi bacterium]|nr:MAG: hypothetical protein E6J49_00400 [Chloroflexota bacterium]
MSSEVDTRRFIGRRARLQEALRDGDTVLAARAASRLRLDGFALSPKEFASARSVRHTLGLAIIKARMARRLPPQPHTATTLRAPKRRSRALIAALAASTLLLLLLIITGRPEEEGGGSAPPAPVAEPQPVLPAQILSRGRTISLAIEVVAVEETPTPAPTVVPTDTPRPVVTSTPGAGSGGGSTGGSGTGSSGSGGGGGTGNRTPSPTPTPAPTATPPVPPAGFSRLNVIVYDNTTGRPLPDVCVVIGTANCGPTAPHTDASGRWSADVAASSNSTLWDLYFIKTGYQRQFRQITLPGGVSRTYIIFMRRG